MLFNERKKKTLEYFAGRQWTRVPRFAVDNQIYPVRAAYRYIKQLHKYTLLRRGRDSTGRLVYKLAPRGARWILKHRGSRV